MKATTITARHGRLVKLGLFNSDQQRIHASVETLVDMDLIAATVKTDAEGGFLLHIPNANYEDREIKRGTLMGKAHKITDWVPITRTEAVQMAKEPKRELRAHTAEDWRSYGS